MKSCFVTFLVLFLFLLHPLSLHLLKQTEAILMILAIGMIKTVKMSVKQRDVPIVAYQAWWKYSEYVSTVFDEKSVCKLQ